MKRKKASPPEEDLNSFVTADAEDLLSRYPEDRDYSEYKFTPEALDKINSVIKKPMAEPRRTRYVYFRPVLRRVAAVAIAFILVFTVLMSTSDATRNGILTFTAKILNGEFFKMQPENDEHPKSIERKYAINAPDGFSLRDESFSSHISRMELVNGEKRVSFVQNVIGKINVSVDDREYRETAVGCYIGYIIVKGKTITLTWANEEYQFTMVASGGFTEEEVLAVAATIHPVD